MSEHDDQQTLFDYCHGYGGNLDGRLKLLHVIANGAWKGTGRMEAGMRESAGIPDMFLPVVTQFYHGLYIELKVKGGKTSARQRAWHTALRKQGYAVEECNIDDAFEVLHEYIDGDYPPF